MGFTFTKKPKHTEILVCGEHNGVPYEFWAKCKALDQSDYKKAFDAAQEAGENDPIGTASGMIPLASELMIEYINKEDEPSRWCVDEEDPSKPVACTPERKAELLQGQGVAYAVVTCYELSRYNQEAVVGNYNASRRSGQGKTGQAARSEPKKK
jgi:hypothetical protein